MARVTLPSLIPLMAGTLDRDTADARIAAFARRVIGRARIRLRVEGAERVPRDRAFVFMSNHQSHMDIPVIYASVPAATLRMVGKKELFRIPLWGTALRAAGFVAIDRGNRAKAIASLDRAGELIQSGVSFWIAPEGSRSKTGALGPLKKGGFHMATKTGTPIVPVAISGTHAVLPPGSINMAYDCPVRVVYGAPIPVDGRTIDELMNEVAAFFAKNVDQP